MSRGKRRWRRPHPPATANGPVAHAAPAQGAARRVLVQRRLERWTEVRRGWAWAGWREEWRLLRRGFAGHPGLAFGWLGIWLGIVRLVHGRSVGWPSWPVTALAAVAALVVVAVLAAATYKNVAAATRRPRRHFAIWAAWRMFVTATMALYLRHLDPSGCSDSASSARCSLYDESAAVSYGFAFLLGGMLAGILALTTRRANTAGVAHMGRWRSTGWAAIALVSIPFCVSLAAQHPWVRDTLVAAVVFVGLRSVLRVLSVELTGFTFDDLVLSWRKEIDE